MLVCVVGLSLGSTYKNQKIEVVQEGISPIVYSFLGILLGIICPISFSANGLIVRYITSKSGYPPGDITIASNFLLSSILMVWLVLIYVYEYYEFVLEELLIIGLSGLIGSGGVLWLNYAVSIGYAGPVYALANTQVILMTILDAVFLGQTPNIIEIVAASFGIFGSISIALGPAIHSSMSSWLKRKKED